ncbi:MAG TPA: hypothetical protein VG649_02650, partial [Candidatus Angelobacter sp.]|nr:hypothetical protein [Candidatus Angelobacter sp.]
ASVHCGLKLSQAARIFSRPPEGGLGFICVSFPPLKRRAIFMRPAGAGLVPIRGHQFQSAFISVELLAAACSAMNTGLGA